MKKIFITLSILLAFTTNTNAQDIPLVYSVENTAAGNADPVFPTIDQLPYIEPLTDPFEFSDGSGRALQFSEWSKRRGEIAREIQHYEIGDKPVVSLDDIEATLVDNVLTVTTTVNGQTLTQTATISYPSGGEAPYPLMIGADNISLPSDLITSRNIATMNFTGSQVNGYSQFGGSGSRGTYPFDALYPDLIDNGAYCEWAWGFSRLLDGLQKLGPEVTKIDMDHIGVTGCSYAGKMALFCGAFDERVALTIAQESGGGGCAAWRVTRVHNRDYKKEDAWEGLDNTDYSWFLKSLKETFAQDKTFYLPYDHHELVALCCPRAFLMLGNPDYKWLADGSGYVSMEAARKVWEQYGIADRCGYSIIDGHSHCQLPESQYPEVEAFLDKFLLGKEADTQDVRKAPVYQEGGSRATALEDLGQWMDWWGTGEAPLLPSNRVESVFFWGDPTEMISATGTDWVVEDDADSPTGKCARATVVNKTCPENPAQALQFNFNVTTPQDYYVYAYVNCAKSSNDAFFIAFDDNTPMVANGAKSKGWAWKNLYALLGSTDKTNFVKNLSEGDHTLYIYDKEIDAKIGLICVSNDESLSDFLSDIENVDLSTVLAINNISVGKGVNIRNVSSEGGLLKMTVDVEDSFSGVIEIFNITGSRVAAKMARLSAGTHTLSLPVNVNKGLFLVKMCDNKNKESVTKKIVIK